MAKRKKYDDDLLVELLATGELNQTEIGKRLGLSENMISVINRGKNRRELYPRILAVRKAYQAQKKREMTKAARQAARKGVGRTHRDKDYDDDLLVELIASGRYTYGQIARKMGLTGSYIRRIASGFSRPDLFPRICKAAAANQWAARRMGAAWLKDMLMKHISQGLKGDDELARRCRENAIDRVWIHDHELPRDPPTGSLPPARGLAELPEPLMTEVLKALGGPEE